MNFSSPALILLHIASFAFVISLSLTGFMISAGLMDEPVDRSNHDERIPTAGGIGMVAGLGAGMLALSLFYPLFADQSLLGSVSAIALGIAFLGLCDDLYDIRALVKFFILLILIGAALTVIGPPTALPFSTVDISIPVWTAFAGSALWMFVTINGVNFMDGCNGLMGGFMIIAFVFLSGISALVEASNAAVFCAICAAAIGGFIPYNGRQNTLIFSGDVGSLLVGFCFAAGALLLIAESGHSAFVYLGPILILPILTDVLVTMLIRLRRRENLFSAHSSHLYQRMIRAGLSHKSVALFYVWAACISGFITVIGLRTGLIRSVFFLALVVCFWTIIYLLLHRKYSNLPDPQQMPPNP